jgi:hypothetical protein
MGVSFADNQRLDDEAAAAHAIYMEVGNITEACRLWRERRGEDMPWTNMKRRIARAQDMGIGEALSAPLPVGQRLRGVSSLYNRDGERVAQWVKTATDPASSALADELTAYFEAYRGKAELIEAPAYSDKELLTAYLIPDHHFGLYAWAEEAGVDHDVEKAQNLLREASNNLVARAPPSGTAVVLNVGDFYHSDNLENRTLRSGHALDVDTRFAKVARLGVQALIETVERAAQKHRRVIVKCISGNHDDHSGVWLSIALDAFFANDPRVEVDRSPAAFWWLKHGRCLVGAAHGHLNKPVQMAAAMATHQPEAWGGTDFRYFWFGHIHHKTVAEIAGVTVESFQTLAPRDAYAAGAGYASNRAMQAITLHASRGEVERQTYSIPFTHSERAIVDTF